MTPESIEGARRTPSDDEMPALLAALAESGGNVAAFARERGLSPWKLYQARRVAASSRRRSPGRKALAEFAEVRVVGELPPSSPIPAAIELVLPMGYRLVIPASFDDQALRRLLKVLTPC
jgi:transposase-like protein